MMNVIVDDFVLKVLERNHIYNKIVGLVWDRPELPQNRWEIGDTIAFKRDAAIEEFCTFGAGNNLYNCGSFSSLASWLPVNTHAGRYVQMDKGGKSLGFKLPIQAVSGNSAFYNFSREYVFSYFQEYESLNGLVVKKRVPIPPQPKDKQIRIGHDVWIGNDVTLSGGINIGTGAVIAAQSVVTHDVPPYAIVAGAPARVRKYRFSDDVIQDMLDSRWWEYELGDMYREGIDFSTPENFLRKFNQICHRLRHFKPKIFYPFKELVLRMDEVPYDALLTEHGTVICVNEDGDKLINERSLKRYVRAHVVENSVSLSNVNGSKFILDVEHDGRIKWSPHPTYFPIDKNINNTISIIKENRFLSARKNETCSLVDNNLDWEQFTLGRFFLGLELKEEWLPGVRDLAYWM